MEGHRKSRLLDLFGHWSDNVVDLIKATPEEDILRRDIYDRSEGAPHDSAAMGLPGFRRWDVAIQRRSGGPVTCMQYQNLCITCLELPLDLRCIYLAHSPAFS